MHTSQYHPLMTVQLHVAEVVIAAVVDIGASASLVQKRLAWKLRMWERVPKVQVKQGNVSYV